MSKNKKVLFIWASVVPCVLLLGFLVVDADPSPDAGYALPFVAIGCIALMLIAAVVIGLLTSTVKQSLLGVLLGLPLTCVLAFAIAVAVTTKEALTVSAQRNEVKALLPAIHSGDRQAIATALGQLRHTSIPLLMCNLVGERDRQGTALVAEDTQVDPKAPFPYSTDTLLSLLDVIAASNISIVEKEAALYSVLRVLPTRDEIQSFPRWVALWDQAHGASSRFIQMEKTYDVHHPFCPWGNTESLAYEVVEGWGEDGIKAWLKTGHTFAPPQQQLVLRKAKSAELIDELVAAGVDMNALSPSP